MKIIGIYKIINPSNKIYIGQSIDINLRFDQYKNLLNSKGQIKLHNSFKKYGIENHKFEIIEECNIVNLNHKERYWQDFYNCLNKGLNCKLTKTNDKSGCLCELTKSKIRKSRINTKLSENTKLKISISHNGLKHSVETKIKMSNSAIGKKRVFTEEHSTNISKSKKGIPLSKEHKMKLSRKVINTETNKIYDNTLEASLDLNINYGTLIQYLSGRRKNKTKLKYIDNE